MMTRPIRLAAIASLLLAGVLIYGLNPTKPETAPGSPSPAAVESRRTATPSSFSTSGASTGAPARTSTGATMPSAAESAPREAASRQLPTGREARTDSSPPPQPRISKLDGNSPVPVVDEAAADVPAAQPPIGLRLAPDVRLPVAAMPHDLKISAIAQEALEQIVIDYYRDLAAGLKSPQPGDPPDVVQVPLEESATGELTRIITNGPATDAARERADYRFKALFGNAAFNRMTIKSALERQAPVASSTE